ncbi:MAG: hypothetical protein HY791_26595 [Deltaproteobacteria bacterium]|nr:hypothetical protein [Deltaproteobacteria bacterium]
MRPVSGSKPLAALEAPPATRGDSAKRVPLSRLRVAVATDGAHELGSLLMQELQTHGVSPLGRALRPEGPPQPTDSIEALARLLVFLARSAQDSEGVSLAALTRLGPKGARAAVLLEKLVASAGPFPEHSRLAQDVMQSARGFVRGAEAALLDRLGPGEWVAPESVGSTAKIAILTSPAKSARFDRLALHLGYGSSLLVEATRRALAGHSTLRLALLPERRDAEVDAKDLTDPQIAALLMRFLGAFKTSGGEFRLDRIEAAYGADVAPITRTLTDLLSRDPPRRPNVDFLAQVLRQLPEILPRKAARVLADAMVRNDELIPRSIAALDAVAKAVGKDAVKDQGLIAVQHLFPTLVPLLEALVAKGMDPTHIHVLGTDYTPNPLVEAYCRLLGMDVRMGYDSGGETRTFEEMRVRRVSEFVDSVARTHQGAHVEAPTPSTRERDDPELPKGGFVVLDDGGLLHRSLVEDRTGPGAEHRKRLPARVVRGIEQTTRGLTELEKLEKLDYPIVRVADSAAKKTHEAPIIGWALVEALFRELAQWGEAGQLQRVTVVSAGAIGMEVAEKLRAEGIQVTLVDKDPAKLAVAASRGFVTASKVEAALEKADLVFSCTGKRALDARSLRGFEGFVASGSSAAVELDARELSAFTSVKILNRGRPINFQGDGFENLPKEAIGLTRALLFSAIARPGAGEGPWRGLDSSLEAIAVEASAQHRAALGSPRPKARAAPRPDESGGVTEPGAWEAFLSAHPLPVLPPPSSAGAFANRSIFKDRDGSIRLVDLETRRSIQLPFGDMPTAMVGGLHRAFLCGADDRGGWVRTLGRNQEGEWEVGARLDGGPCIGARMGSSALEWGYVFEAKSDLVVFDPGKLDSPRRVKKALSGESCYVLSNSGSIDQIQASTGKVRRLEGDGPPTVVPKGWTSVEAKFDHRLETVLLGRTSDGLQAVGWATGGDVTLPPGAVFRGIEGPSSSEAKVLYFAPGGLDEVDRHPSVSLPHRSP